MTGTTAGTSKQVAETIAQERENPSGSQVEKVEDIINEIGFGRFQVFMLFFTGFCWTADAMEIILVSIVAKGAHCDLQQPAPGVAAGATTVTQYLTMATFLGALVGAYFFGVLSDVFGRRKGLFILCTFTVILALLSAAAHTYWALILLRALTGAGLGGTHIALTTFTETLPTNGRQGFSIIMQAFFVLGSVIESALAWGVLTVDRNGWRWLLLVSAFPFVILTITYPFIPESPRWLISNGYYQEATKVLQKIAKFNGTTLTDEQRNRLVPPEAKKGFEQESEQLKMAKGVSIKKVLTEFVDDYKYLGTVLKGKKFLRTFLVMLFVWFSNGLIYYGLVQIPTQVKPSGATSFACNANGGVDYNKADYKNLMISNVIDYPGLLFVAILMMFVGRKMSFAITMTLCFIVLIPQAVFVLPKFLYRPWADKAIAGFQYASRACITGTFAILYVFTPEVFSTQIRTQCVGTSVSSSRLGATISPFIAVQMTVNHKADKAFGLFAAFAGASAILIHFIPFETKGKKMLETKFKVQDVVQSGKSQVITQEESAKNSNDELIQSQQNNVGSNGAQKEDQQNGHQKDDLPKV